MGTRSTKQSKPSPSPNKRKLPTRPDPKTKTKPNRPLIPQRLLAALPARQRKESTTKTPAAGQQTSKLIDTTELPEVEVKRKSSVASKTSTTTTTIPDPTHELRDISEYEDISKITGRSAADILASIGNNQPLDDDDNFTAGQLRRRFSIFAPENPEEEEENEAGDDLVAPNAEDDSFSTDAIVAIIKKRRADKIIDEDDEFEERSDSGGWQKASLAMILFLIVMVAAHTFAGIYLFLTPEPYENPYTCRTGSCKRMGRWLGEAMNSSVSPCDDFYLYACGKYLSTFPPVENENRTTPVIIDGIPYSYEDNTKLGMFLKPVDEYPLNQILPFYQSCIFQKIRDKRGYQPLVNILTELKLLYPSMGGTADRSITRILARIYKITGKMYLLDVYELVHQYVTVGIPKPAPELQRVRTKDYAETMARAFQILSKPLQIDGQEEIETIVHLVMSFEAELFIVHSKGTALPIFGFPNNMHKYMTVPKQRHRNYNEKVGTFEWNDFIDELFLKDTAADEEDKPVLLFNYIHSVTTQEDRFQLLVLRQFLVRTPYYTMLRYFQWSLMKLFAFDLTSEFQQLMQDIFPTAGKTDIERCFRSVFENLNVLAAERYTMSTAKAKGKHKAQFHSEIETVIQVITEGIQNISADLPYSLKENIKDTLTTVKISNVLLRNISNSLDIYYEGLNVTESDYFSNLIQAKVIRARNDIYRLRKKYPFQDWPMSSYSLNEVNMVSTQNELANYRYLYIPFGAMYEPFVGNDLPVLDFGGFGYWIGSYYFMYQAVLDLLQKMASERNSLEDAAQVKYQKNFEKVLLPRLECIYNAFSELELPQLPGVKLNPFGSSSRLKVLASSIAIEALTKIHALNYGNRTLFPEHQLLPNFEHYSPDRLLFHSIARQACLTRPKNILPFLMEYGPLPFHLQINGAFRLSPIFSKAWQCPKESFMNPRRKCQFFRPVRNYVTDLLSEPPPDLAFQQQRQFGYDVQEY